MNHACITNTIGIVFGVSVTQRFEKEKKSNSLSKTVYSLMMKVTGTLFMMNHVCAKATKML